MLGATIGGGLRGGISAAKTARSISHKKENRDSNSGGFWSSAWPNQVHQPLTWDQQTLDSQVTNPGARDAPQEWQQQVIDRDRELQKERGEWGGSKEFGYRARKLAPHIVGGLASSHLAGAVPVTNAVQSLATALGKKGANYSINQFISGQARKGMMDDFRMRAEGMSEQDIRNYNAKKTRSIMGEDLFGGGRNREEFFETGQAIGKAMGLKTIAEMPVETPPPVIDPPAQGPAPSTANNVLSRQRRLMGNPFAAQKQRLGGVLGARG
jgi:hypothetical protein